MKFVVIFLAGVFSVFVGALNLPLEVSNWTDISRTSEPVTAGVPLPSGAVYDLSKLRIVDGFGNNVPAQFRPLTKWYWEKFQGVTQNPSVKWVLCDFQADVAATDKSAFALKDDNAFPAPSTALSVTDAPGSVTVVTGPLKFAVSKTRFNLFDGVWLDANNNTQFENSEQVIAAGNFNNGAITAGDWNAGECLTGTVHTTLEKAPERVVIEEQGPMKVVIRVEGRHFAFASGVTRGLYGYQVFITAYAGKPYVEVQWGITNTYIEGDQPENGATPYTAFVWPFTKYSLDLNLNLNAASQNYALLGASEVSGALSASPVRLSQKGGSYTITGAAGGTDAKGGASISDGSLGVMVAMRDFAPNAPKAITVEKNKISLELLPDTTGNYWLDPLSRKNHRMRLEFFKGTYLSGSLTNLWKSTDAPLRMLAPREWYRDTKAWERGCGIPPQTAWNRTAPSAWTRLAKTSTMTWMSHMVTDWVNYGWIEEFDGAGDHWNLTSVFHQYLMTGNPADFEAQEASTFHFNDIVPIQTSSTRWQDLDYLLSPSNHLPQMMNIHNPGDLNDYTIQHSAFPGFSFHRSNIPDQAHMPQKELLEYYCLTGDWATLASIESQGVRGVGLVYYGLYNAFSSLNYASRGDAPIPIDSICSGSSWTTIRMPPRNCMVILDAYEATGDDRYAYPAKVEAYHLRNMGRRSPIGYITNAEKYDPYYFGVADSIWKVNHPSVATPWSFYASEFMLGIVEQGLYHYFEVTRDDEIRDAVIHSGKSAEQRAAIVSGKYTGWNYEGWGDIWCDGKRLSDVGIPGGFSSSMAERFGGINFCYLISGRKDFYAVIKDAIPSHYDRWDTPGQQDPKTLNMWDAIFRHDSTDTVPPATVTDLQATVTPGVGVQLSWTAPGDDGATGIAAQYQVKYTKAPIVDFVKRWDAGTQTGWPDLRTPLPYSDTAVYNLAANYLKTEISFWASDNVSGETAPKTAGAAEAFTVYGGNSKLESNTPYYFALVSYDKSGNVSGISNVVTATTGLVGAEAGPGKDFSEMTMSCKPTPFNPQSTVCVNLPKAAPIVLQVHDCLGKLVQTVVSGRFGSGKHSFSWEGVDQNGHKAASGVYFYRLISGNKTIIIKTVMMK